MNYSLAKKYFEKEAPSLHRLFSRFESSSGEPVTWAARLDAKVPYMEIKNFPLPDSYCPKDYEDIIISLANYPDSPPNGIYIHKNSITNLEKIKSALEGHIYDITYNAKDSYKNLEDKGWLWICFHMENNSWKYNFDSPMKGDCLYGYLLLLFAALDGNYTK